MDISVVVPTYNNREVLRETLRCLYAQTLAPETYEIIVVDDGSTDDTAAMVAAVRRGPEIRYLTQPHRGRSTARNLGARAARGRIVLFIDADIWAVPTLLATHLGHYPEGDRRVGVQGRSMTHPDSRTTPFMRARDITPDLSLRRRRDLSPVHIITRNFSILRSEFDAAGGFDEGFTGYGWEDIELAMRLHARGVRFVYEPEALAYHYHVETLEGVRRKLREAGDGAVYFWLKHNRSRQLGIFLEILPAVLPLKWLVFRTRLFMPAFRRLLSYAERRGWLLLANECYTELGWEAYYEGVFAARRRLRQTSATTPRPAAAAGPTRALGSSGRPVDGD